ncbi:b(0,+)-type amino acid transporter 1-like isoform X2 [Pomacea canaliculata]|uniref:b(0,+)-type amino acid transporter 1-like isoform X2 n=1 Tax=Pomacea canaliculata TaxID=400727 RepID=UPI000D730487|nr:b(0,+)-type amino acid transporter 1-like isoform X2 [Pomacea canaliculata]
MEIIVSSPAASKEVDKEAESEQKLSGEDVEIKTFEMKRELGFTSSIAIIIGTIVGSGIFVSPKGVLQRTGSVALSLIVWVGAGLIGLLGGLCYIELGTLIQKSGGDYTYLKAALGNIFAFEFMWVSVIVGKTSSLAIMTLTLAEYVVTFFGPCVNTEALKKMIAAAAVVLVGIVNCYSVRLAARVQVLTTAIKVAALVIILVGGVVMLFEGKTENLKTGFSGSTDSPSQIALAFYGALFAYDGWANLNNVIEEVKDPAKTLPRAIVAAILMVILLYTLTNVSYLTIMTSTELLESDAVAMLWGKRVLKSAAIIMPLSVIASTFGSSNGSAFTGSRLIFAAARDNNLPAFLSYIHVKQRTPLTSTIFTIAVALLMIAAGDVFSLIDFLSFLGWLFYGLNFSAVVILRFKMKDAPRPYRVIIS